MSEPIHKAHNVSVLLYHLVCVAKYRRVVMTGAVDSVIRDVCLDISVRYEIRFLEIGSDRDHRHFLVQSVPMDSPTNIVRVIKSLTAATCFCVFLRSKNRCGAANFGRTAPVSVPLVIMELKH